jgi:hypothetical protein
MTPEEISDYLIGLEEEISNFKKDLAQLSWYMRGGVTYEQLLHIYSYDDREAMYKVIKDNIELTKNSGMPLV